MALATNTQPGEIQLAGDLGGNNDATAPELSPSGVVAGQFTLPQITVDGKGRITNAQTSDPAALNALLQNASATQRGVVQAGDGLDVHTNDTAGYQEIFFNSAITGGEVTGLDTCASYLVKINVDTLATQTLVFSGNVATMQDVVDEINLVLSDATASITGGVIRITSASTGRGSFVEIVDDALFTCMTDFNSIDFFVRGFADCEMFAPDATTISKGIVEIGDNIEIDNGVISINLVSATDTTLGSVIVPISGNLDIDINGNISVPVAGTTSLGVVQVPGGDGLSVDGSGNLTISTGAIANATTSTKGVVQIGTNINVAVGIISVDTTTNATKGVVQIDTTDGLNIAAGILGIDIATSSATGVVQVPGGDGLSVDGSGNLTFTTSNLANATTSTKGVVQIGTNIDVASGVISVANATTVTKGVVQINTTDGLNIAAGLLGVDIATISSKGVVQVPGGDGLSVDGLGNLTFTTSNLPTATTSSKGVVQIGTNIDVAAGVISVANATDTNKGVVQINTTDGLNIAAGVLGVDIASSGSKGVVQVPTTGSGLVLDGSGNLTFSPSTLANATTSTKGIVQVGTNIDVAAGVISVADATNAIKGVVQIDTTNGLNIAGSIVGIDIATDIATGVIQIPTGNNGLAVDGSGNLTIFTAGLDDATISTKGIVQVGTNIDVAAGVISVADATNAIKGVATTADSNNITISAGAIDVGTNIGKLDTANTWTAANATTPDVLAFSSTINTDASLSNIFTLTATGNFTLANPTNLIAGGRYTFLISQDATGSRLITLGSAYKFKIGSNKLLSTTANSTDILTCLSDGTNLYCSLAKEFV